MKLARWGALGLLAALAAPPIQAQPFELPWWTVDGGGLQGATGGVYLHHATAGQPDAGGPYSGGSYVVMSGFWARAAGGTAALQADLSITKSDGQTSATPGQLVTYEIVVANAGPDPVTGALVTDGLPMALTHAAWSCVGSGGGACTRSGSGGISDSVALPVAATVTYSLTATVAAAATGSLVNTATVGVPAGAVDPDPADNSTTDVDVLTMGFLARGELQHGSALWADLSSAGGNLDVDLYRIGQRRYSSFEVVVDGTSADIGAGQGPELDRVASDGNSVLQTAVAAGAGASRSLRWENHAAMPVNDQFLRVRSLGCTTTCGPASVYRIRAWDTTLVCPRFNNSATQVTVLILQNTSAAPVSGHVQLWDGAGALVAEQAFSLAPRAAFVLNTSAVPGAAGVSGTLTLSHDGSYGVLVGKAVALESATGFAFDTALQPRVK